MQKSGAIACEKRSPFRERRIKDTDIQFSRDIITKALQKRSFSYWILRNIAISDCPAQKFRQAKPLITGKNALGLKESYA